MFLHVPFHGISSAFLIYFHYNQCLILVLAVKGTNQRSLPCSFLIPNRSFARITMLRPQVSHLLGTNSCAASARSFSSLPSTGMNASVTCFPQCNGTYSYPEAAYPSPAASIAFGRSWPVHWPGSDLAHTRNADGGKQAPMVGARQINRATRFVTDVGFSMPASWMKACEE